MREASRASLGGGQKRGCNSCVETPADSAHPDDCLVKYDHFGSSVISQCLPFRSCLFGGEAIYRLSFCIDSTSVVTLLPFMSVGRDPLLGDSSFEKTNKICYEPFEDSIDGKTQDYLIYLMPGNPGLIQYYEPFLSKLHALLSSSSTTESSRFHICGHSLTGFEVAQNGKKFRPPRVPLGLEEQIEVQEKLLYDHIKSHRDRTGNSPKVILMGHSVGCYILLELIQQHRKKIEDEGEEDFDLIGGILLFPTITHIAESPLGRVFGVRTLDPLPSLQLNPASDSEFSQFLIFQ